MYGGGQFPNPGGKEKAEGIPKSEGGGGKKGGQKYTSHPATRKGPVPMSTAMKGRVGIFEERKKTITLRASSHEMWSIGLSPRNDKFGEKGA